MTTTHPLTAWSALQAHYEQIRDARLRDWFAPENDPAPTRAERYTFSAVPGLAADTLCAQGDGPAGLTAGELAPMVRRLMNRLFYPQRD